MKMTKMEVYEWALQYIERTQVLIDEKCEPGTPEGDAFVALHVGLEALRGGPIGRCVKCTEMFVIEPSCPEDVCISCDDEGIYTEVLLSRLDDSHIA